MVKFGIAGKCNKFFEEGHQDMLEMPAWLNRKGLELFEYSFGRGVQLRSETAATFGAAAKEAGIEFSVHAPYYINMASEDEVKALNSVRYILQSLKALSHMGGRRCIFHAGSVGGLSRAEAFSKTMSIMERVLEEKEKGGYHDLILCPETMGKLSQIGSDPEEILKICLLDSSLIPCYDFGHINSATNGSLKTKDDYRRLIDRIFEVLGEERAKVIHIHFTKIMYGAKGEIRHLTFDDDTYGPEFLPLAEVLYDYKMSPSVISESDGTQAEDALIMKALYQSVVIE
ncbi:MAG TPA: TIM barrel protein [Eubacteriales bacterium]|nr:TIM barrel protein [Eubacteriales bacterium]